MGWFIITVSVDIALYVPNGGNFSDNHTRSTKFFKNCFNRNTAGTFLVVQWLRLCFPMQEAGVRDLIPLPSHPGLGGGKHALSRGAECLLLG